MSKIPAPCTDPYDYKGHSGVDVCRGPSKLGKPFYASAPGRVVRLSKNDAGGCWIVVRYDNTPRDVGYAHMNNHNGCPKPGTRFNAGAQLGFVGALGRRVTGAHIHLEAMGEPTPAAIYGIFDFTRAAGPVGSTTGTGKRNITVNRSVADVQRAVGAKPDGIWGFETLTKVKDFQRKHGLTVDGIWGPASDRAAFNPKPQNTGDPKVKATQSTLVALGFTLKVDGIKGPATTNAIRSFQRHNGLVVDGIWGPKSQAKADSTLAAKRPVLRRSSRGDAVRIVQRKVGVKADGIYGPATESAVKAFQKKSGLAADGIVGYKTWLKLGV